jgi:hypothetical protein
MLWWDIKESKIVEQRDEGTRRPFTRKNAFGFGDGCDFYYTSYIYNEKSSA